MFVCAGDSEQFDFAEAIGIGMVDAAISLSRLCIEKRPDKIIFVGSAGSYGKHGILDIVESSVAVNLENSALEGRSYTPAPNQAESIFVREGDNVSHETIVNSSNYITTDTDLSRKYLDKGIDLENMEFYAVLKVAERFGIPALGVFAVTNFCDDKAHEDFVSNRAKAMEKLTRYIKDTYA